MAATRRPRTPASPETIDQARRRRREHLSAAVSSLQSEEGFRAWLRATKAFHRYSRLLSGRLRRRRERPGLARR